jgi:hypothetical protein
MSTTAVHVYQPGNLPPYHENTPQAHYVEYNLEAPKVAAFRDIFVHDAPVDEKQRVWLEEAVYARLQQGGVIRYLPSPSPVSGKPRVSER